MQYLLTKEEYEDLKRRAKTDEQIKATRNEIVAASEELWRVIRAQTVGLGGVVNTPDISNAMNRFAEKVRNAI